MKTQIRQILNVLAKHDDYVGASVIADETGFSARYIRSLINEAEEEEKTCGFVINAGFRKGWQLIITDQQRFETFMNETDDSVAAKVLLDLIDSGDYLRLDDLAEKYFVSRSSMERAMKDVRRMAEHYGLDISMKQKYGIRIEGSELARRRCYAHLVGRAMMNAEGVEIIREILYSVLERYNYQISDLSFNNLVSHIVITLRRVRKGEIISQELSMKEAHPRQEEIADELIRQLSLRLKIDIPASEKGYLILHLLGKEIIDKSSEIEPEIIRLTDEILAAVKEKNHIDLSGDMELRVSLCLHLQPMLYRMQYGFIQDNPMTGKIKAEMPAGYELALTASSLIQEKYGFPVQEDETAYLALHFSLSLEKGQTRSVKKVLVICATGRGTARMLRYHLTKFYHVPEEDIDLSSSLKLSSLDLTPYACILSTVPLPAGLPVPAVTVPAMDIDNNEKVRTFLQNSLSSSRDHMNFFSPDLFLTAECSDEKEALRLAAHKAEDYFQEGEERLFTSLLEREKMSSTAVGNGCALPHPADLIPVSSFCLVIVLHHEIRWGEMKVRVLLFAAIRPEDDQAGEEVDRITAFVTNRALVHDFLDEPSFDKLMECM